MVSVRPKFSIVTVCMNSAETIEETLESISNQTVVNLEMIVIDGGSTDGTLSIIKRYASSDARIHWVSEPDRGIYDAMNKGVCMATGEFVGILNSDDVYENNGVLQAVARLFEESGADCVYGDLYFVEPDQPDRIVRRWIAGRGSFLNGWNPPHPSTFIRNKVYRNHGLYRWEDKISADYELLYRFLHRERISKAYLNEMIVRMRLGGASTGTLRNIIRGNCEIYAGLRRNREPLRLWITIARLFRKIVQLV